MLNFKILSPLLKEDWKNVSNKMEDVEEAFTNGKLLYVTNGIDCAGDPLPFKYYLFSCDKDILLEDILLRTDDIIQVFSFILNQQE